MMHKHARKVPRYHPDLEWERRTLSNDFIDINRMALDDSFSGKNAAPLSKRRNGIGYTDGKTPGLFGLGSNYGDPGWTRILENKDAANYTSAQDVLDAYKLRIISKRDASNVLLNKFQWSTEEVFHHTDLAEYVSGQRPPSPPHPNDNVIFDVVDNTLPVQVQAQEVVPAGDGKGNMNFVDPKMTFLLGSLVAVGAYTTLDWIMHKPNQTRIKKMVGRTPASLIVAGVAFTLFSTSA